MQNGILERIEAKLDQLLSKSTVAVAVQEVVGETPNVAPTVGTAPSTPTVAPTVNVAPTIEPSTVNVQENSVGSVDRDASGMIWDERIHAKNKAKTVKNLWKAGKGVDATLKAQVLVELKAEAANVVTVTASTDTSPTAAPTVTPPTVVAPIVTPTVTPPPIVTPNTPTFVAPTVGADPSAGLKQTLIQQVQTLVTTHKVDYSNVLEVIADCGNAKTLDELAPAYYEKASAAFKLWAEWLVVCQAEVDAIVQMGAQAGSDGVTTICSQYGVALITEVHHAELNEVYQKLQTYKGQWKTAVAGQ